MGKQDDIIRSNQDKLTTWFSEDRPITWICKTLKISVDKFRQHFPNYIRIKNSHNQYIEEKILYTNTPNVCKNCNTALLFSNRKNKFCCQSCSAKYNNKCRIKLKPKQLKRKYCKVTKNCIVCQKPMHLTPFAAKRRKYCSGTCRNKINNSLIRGVRSKAEKLLEVELNRHFSDKVILFNDRKTLEGLELDVYIPEIKTAIEWNGIFHLRPIHKDIILFEKIQKRDQLKANICKQKGINLIVINDEASSNKFIAYKIVEIISILKDLFVIVNH